MLAKQNRQKILGNDLQGKDMTSFLKDIRAKAEEDAFRQEERNILTQEKNVQSFPQLQKSVYKTLARTIEQRGQRQPWQKSVKDDGIVLPDNDFIKRVMPTPKSKDDPNLIVLEEIAKTIKSLEKESGKKLTIPEVKKVVNRARDYYQQGESINLANAGQDRISQEGLNKVAEDIKPKIDSINPLPFVPPFGSVPFPVFGEKAPRRQRRTEEYKDALDLNEKAPRRQRRTEEYKDALESNLPKRLIEKPYNKERLARDNIDSILKSNDPSKVFGLKDKQKSQYDANLSKIDPIFKDLSVKERKKLLDRLEVQKGLEKRVSVKNTSLLDQIKNPQLLLRRVDRNISKDKTDSFSMKNILDKKFKNVPDFEDVGKDDDFEPPKRKKAGYLAGDLAGSGIGNDAGVSGLKFRFDVEDMENDINMAYKKMIEMKPDNKNIIHDGVGLYGYGKKKGGSSHDGVFSKSLTDLSVGSNIDRFPEVGRENNTISSVGIDKQRKQAKKKMDDLAHNVAKYDSIGQNYMEDLNINVYGSNAPYNSIQQEADRQQAYRSLLNRLRG